MHTEMWEHPATRANVATLRARGVASCSSPPSGRLTGADTGPGRLPEPDEIFAALAAAAARRRPGRAARSDLAGRRVVVSAGGTREPLDPVRFLGNRSSGKQGYALARGGRGPRRRGHPGRGQRRPAGARPACEVVPVGTAAELRDAVHRGRRGRRRRRDGRRGGRLPARRTYAEAKIKKRDDPDADAARRRSSWSATPTSSPSWSPSAGQRHRRQVIVGFAAETGDDDGDVLDARPGQAGPQGLRPARGQRGRRRQDVRPATATSVHILPARAPSAVHRRRARPKEDGRGRRCGTSIAGRPAAPIRLARDRPVSSRCIKEHRTCPPPLHVRVRHRGPPGQDRRPDQRRDPRRDARAGPAQPRRGRDDGHHRPGARRRRGHHRGLRRHPHHRPRDRSLGIGYDSSPKGFDGALLRRRDLDRRSSPPTSPRASTPPTRRAPAASTRSTSRAPATRA